MIGYISIFGELFSTSSRHYQLERDQPNGRHGSSRSWSLGILDRGVHYRCHGIVIGIARALCAFDLSLISLIPVLPVVL
jgi:hypothetical protein